MLERARKKAGLDIPFYRQDCTKLNLTLEVPLIFMIGSSFRHFLTNEDQNALFESIKRHLQPNGYFIFDTRSPLLGELAEIFDPITQVLHCTAVMETVEDGEVAHVEKSSISLRYTYPQELFWLIEGHGFELIALFGDWSKT